MEIESLWVRDFRNIEDARINISAKETWMIGLNASGKTSLLEALYVLLRGHTFLSARHGPLVREGADRAAVECRFRSNDRKLSKLSCSIKGRACRARLDDAEVTYQSLVDQCGLIRFFGGNAQELIAGEPRIRRSFIDWNLLHVEPSYRSLSATYSRLLLQRNAALKARAVPVAVWDADLASLSEKIGALRESYLVGVAAEIEVIGARIFQNKAPVLRWSHGWPKDLGMEAALQRNADSDRQRGFTQCGAHRFSATLSIGSASTSGSRGEQKLLAAIFQLACETMHLRAGGEASIWLIDDVFSELSRGNSALLIDSFRAFGGQIFFTGMTEPEKDVVLTTQDHRLFHVEHGTIRDTSR